MDLQALKPFNMGIAGKGKKSGVQNWHLSSKMAA